MPELLAAFMDWLGAYRLALTEPGFQNLVVIVVGWVQTTGRHAVTQSLVATGVAGRRHHEAFHRFFSRGTWTPDRLGYWLFERVRRVCDLDAMVTDPAVEYVEHITRQLGLLAVRLALARALLLVAVEPEQDR